MERLQLVWHAGVTLNSDPVEKWLPGSFFNVKSDSPGHFSTLKADTVQILILNFEPHVVKKWLPPWNFDFQGGGGSSFNDFSTLKISLYTPANEVVEVYWFHHSCLSVCPSVKKWFLYNNSSSIWQTMMILHIYVDLDPPMVWYNICRIFWPGPTYDYFQLLTLCFKCNKHFCRINISIIT